MAINKRKTGKRNPIPQIQRLIELVNSACEVGLPDHFVPFVVCDVREDDSLANAEEVTAQERLLRDVEMRLQDSCFFAWIEKYGLDPHRGIILLIAARELLEWIASLRPIPGLTFRRASSIRIYEVDDCLRLHFAGPLEKTLEGVDASRIRKCRCGKFFWVKTTGKRRMTGCCPTHSAAEKMRRLRKENPLKYK